MRLYLNSSHSFFRVYDKGVNGFTLIFSQTGMLIRVLNREGTDIVDEFRKGADSIEVKKKFAPIDESHGKSVDQFIENLVSQKILTPEEQFTNAVWIDPSGAPTLLSPGSGKCGIMFFQFLTHIFRDGASSIDSHREFLPYLDGFSPNLPGNCLAVDIGCGSGYYSDALLEKGMKTVSVDVSLERLHVFKNRSRGKPSNSSIDLPRHPIVSRAEALPFKTGRFDLILCIFVLEHVMDVDQVIKEIVRIAKPQAKILIAIPSLSLWETMNILLHRREPELNLAHFRNFGLLSRRIPWCWDSRQLLKNLQGAGIKLEQIRVRNFLGIEFSGFFKKKLCSFFDGSIGRFFPFNRFGEQTIIVGRKK